MIKTDLSSSASFRTNCTCLTLAETQGSYPGDSLQVEGEQVRIHSDEISIKLLQTHKHIRFSNRLM